MTDIDAIATEHARVAIDSARRRHQRAAFMANRAGHDYAAHLEAEATRRLMRLGPGETIVVREIRL